MESAPRMTSIAGVSRAMIAAVGVDDTVAILVEQFGWDVAFTVLAELDGPDAGAAMWRAAEMLCHDDDATPG